MTARRALVLGAVWTLPSALFLLLTWWVYSAYRIDEPPHLSDAGRTEVMRILRAALDGPAAERAAAAASDPELSRPLPGRGPLLVSLWLDGKAVARQSDHGDTIAAAVSAVAARLAASPDVTKLDAAARRRARLKVDIVDGRGSLLRHFGLLENVAMNPGLEGVGVTLPGGDEVVLPADELFLLGLLAKKRPFALIPDVALGLDFEKADMILAQRAGLPAGGYGAADRRYFRFRSDAFVERPADRRDSGPPLPLMRGLTPGPDLDAATLRSAALAGARYLIAHLAANGRYVYERNLTTGEGTDPTRPGPYSIPRHAGSTYFLAEIYRITKEEWLREPIERAFAHLEELIEAGGCSGVLPDGTPFECVIDRGEKIASLGSTALTVVALAEYQRATGYNRYEPTARKLAAWILYMQRPNGSFAHQYDVARKTKNEKIQQLYYSGEAALAMARMHVITGEEQYRVAAAKAIDWLVDWYDFFVGGFLYGEEHWTCIAAEAIFPAAKNERWREFCDGYGRFLRMQQPEPGDHPDNTDLVGSYGMTPFVIPNNTPAGSRTEAMISAYLLGKHMGHGDDEVRQQVLLAMRFALHQQIGPDNDFAVAADIPGIGHGHGGIPSSAIDRSVRIDYVQHVCSAMIRSIELVESSPK